MIRRGRRRGGAAANGEAMEKDRLVAFTDGVVAIIITIMVLDLKVPEGASFAALAAVTPVFLCYALSFVYVGIYWSNHHHFFHLVRHVTGAMLWANLHLLFWLSLVPFATWWLGESHFAPVPSAVYGVALLMPALAWYLMQAVIIRAQGKESALARALGRDIKGKISPVFYAAGILLAFVDVRMSTAMYVLVALMWLVPDRRVERTVRGR
jgi:TMEM175 potassium channel family protein